MVAMAPTSKIKSTSRTASPSSVKVLVITVSISLKSRPCRRSRSRLMVRCFLPYNLTTTFLIHSSGTSVMSTSSMMCSHRSRNSSLNCISRCLLATASFGRSRFNGNSHRCGFNSLHVHSRKHFLCFLFHSGSFGNQALGI